MELNKTMRGIKERIKRRGGKDLENRTLLMKGNVKYKGKGMISSNTDIRSSSSDLAKEHRVFEVQKDNTPCAVLFQDQSAEQKRGMKKRHYLSPIQLQYHGQ